MSESLELVGAHASPYTRKMRAVLRYRRIPHEFVVQSEADTPPVPVAVIPILVTRNSESGEATAEIDSTPLIRKLESRYEGRSVIPDDPVLEFIDALVEDYGDEWLTKAMFHYRWAYAADIARAKAVLPIDFMIGGEDAALREQGEVFGERQISRLHVVGSNEETAPLIEASYERLIRILSDLVRTEPFLFGGRPASADFGLYGQLTQLACFDPTPMELTIRVAPRVFGWVMRMEDLGTTRYGDGRWLGRDDALARLAPLLEEIGATYLPFLEANAAAVAGGSDEVRLEIAGRTWTQKPFKYQAKCLVELRRRFAELSDGDREVVAAAIGDPASVLAG